MNQEYKKGASGELSVKSVFLLVVMVVGIGSGVIATLTFGGLRGRASIFTVSPTPFFEPSPPPASHLTSPYVRLVARGDSSAQSVPVDVYIHTGGHNTMEATIALSYDPQLLTIGDGDILSTDVYRSISVNAFRGGEVNFTLFINPQIGQEGVSTDGEIRVATLTFQPLTTARSLTQIELLFEKGSTEMTSLIGFDLTRPEKGENLLESVEGVSFEIEP